MGAQIFNLYLFALCQSARLWKPDWRKHLPVMFNRLDDETKCRTDSIDVFTQYAFDNCRLAGVVKSSDGTCQPKGDKVAGSATHSIKIRISLSFRRAFLNIDNIA